MTHCAQQSTSDLRLLWLTTMFSSILSLFGASFMLVSYFTFGKKKNQLSRLVAFLALSDYGWAAVVITTYALLLWDPTVYTFPLCAAFRVGFQFFASSSVFWTSCISFYLYYAVRYQSKIRSKLIWTIFYGVSWGLPIAIAVLMLAAGWIEESSLAICFPREPYELTLWFLPNLLSFVVTAVNYVLIQTTLQKQKVRFSIYSFGSLAVPVHYRVSLYLLVLIFCWTLDIIVIMAGYGGACLPFGMTIAYAFILQLQGALDAVVYGVTNRQFRQHYSGNKVRAIIVLLVSPILIVPAFVYFLTRRDTENEELKTVNNSTSSDTERVPLVRA